MERDIVRKIGIGLTAALFIAAVAAPAIASKPLAGGSDNIVGGHKITICHATSSAATHQFWEVITVDVASSGGLKKLQGHVGHSAFSALSEPNNRGRFDVIPSFTYANLSFDGASDAGSGDLDGDGADDWDEWADLNPEDAAACEGEDTNGTS